MILLLVLVIGVPFFIMVSLSLQTMPEIYSADMVWFPEKPQFVNYVNAMNSGSWGPVHPKQPLCRHTGHWHQPGNQRHDRLCLCPYLL